jgi:aminopeptidase N
LLEDADPHLRIDVVRALVDMGDSKSRPALRARLEMDLDARVRRRLREGLRDIGEGGKRAADQLREELEKLTNEHTELRTRMGVLEAKLGEGPKAKAGSTGKSKKASVARPSKKGKR